MSEERISPLPVESGKPRVQRLVDQLAPVHLELEPPLRDPWTVRVDGMVAEALELTLAGLVELGGAEVAHDFHCVWGWSRPRVNWAGVPSHIVLDAVGVDAAATHVRFAAADGHYASCVPIAQARDGLFVLELEGTPLPPIHGGPVRWLQPGYMWGYKGVKWVTSMTLIDRMEAGPWETKVGDVDGMVPEGIIDRFARLEAAE